MSSVYKINKGINKPIEFKGLKAQYIAYLAIGLVGLLILFAILYITGVNMFFCLALTLILGTVLFMTIYHMSDKYGQHGLLKKLAKRRLPIYIKVSSRKTFLNLKNPSPRGEGGRPAGGRMRVTQNSTRTTNHDPSGRNISHL